MKGWKNVKVLTEEEKQAVFTADSEKQRDRAEEHAKRERRAKAAKDAQHKESQNERQRRHRAKRRAEGDNNPRRRKEMKVSNLKPVCRFAYKCFSSTIARLHHALKSLKGRALLAKLKPSSNLRLASPPAASKRRRSGLQPT
jgi:hypothetical protein